MRARRGRRPPWAVRATRVAGALCGALCVLLAGVGSDGALAAAGTAAATGAVLTPPPATCPTGDQCVVIGTGAAPPEAVVGPTSNLGSAGEGDQWIYVTLYDFPPGNLVTLHYCTDTAPLSSGPPLCDDAGTQEFPSPIAQLPIGPHGTASLSVQVEEQLPADDTPLEGAVPGKATTGTFYCDDGPDLCALDITDPSLDTTSGGIPIALNTAVVPVTFAAPSTGCPGAAEVSSESDFGIGFLLPAATTLSCAGTNPALALNISQNDLAAVQALAAGTDEIAFIDNPESPDIENALAGSSTGFTFIPVAVSADVIGFRALMFDRSNRYVFPDANFQLTPTAAAGILTYTYTGPVNSDLVPCASVPTKALSGLVGTSCRGGQVSLLSVANESGSFLTPREYATYVRSDASGSTQELLTWLCSAPSVPVAVAGGTVSDPNLARTVLESGFSAGGDTSPACPASGATGPTALASDQWPALSSFSQSYAQALSPPSKQVAVLDSNVPAPSVSDTTYLAGFAPMVWSEASYYGLDVASLQNAAGAWVQPNQASIDAALGAATVNADGTLTFNFDDPTAATAYPMPDVIYAVVPKAPLPAAEATAVRSALNSVLSVSDEPTSDLPGGFVQLPSNLFAQATADVANDIVSAAPGTQSTGGKSTGGKSTGGKSTAGEGTRGPGSTGSSGSGGTGSGGGSSRSSSSSGSSVSTSQTARTFSNLYTPTPGLISRPFDPSIARAGFPPPSPTATTSRTRPRATPLVIPTPRILAVAAVDDRWLGAGLAGGLAWTLVLGPGLFLALEVRRRSRIPHAAATDATDPAGGPPNDTDTEGAAPT